MKHQPQANFPFIEEYRKVFAVTPETIFAYNDSVYCDYQLTPDLVAHEKVHLKRQKKIGADNWVQRYLTDTEFRLNEEVLAYREQLQSIKDREIRNRLRIESAHHLSSSLYGNIVNIDDALRLLR